MVLVFFALAQGLLWAGIAATFVSGVIEATAGITVFRDDCRSRGCLFRKELALPRRGGERRRTAVRVRVHAGVVGIRRGREWVV